LNFLSTRDEKAEGINDDGGSSRADDEDTRRGGESEIGTLRSTHSQVFDASEAEKLALIEQEDKLKRIKTRKMDQFWKGLRKEHEVLVLFGKRGSALSNRRLGASTKNLGTAQTRGVTCPGGMSRGPAMFARDTTSTPKGSTTISSKSSETDEKLMKAAAGRMQAGGTFMSTTEREEKIQELEEYVNMAHRSTVFLTQLLSFLAMAVFFYEESESLFSEVRWNQIRTADNAEAAYLILENVLEGFVQVLLTVPITFSMISLFKQLDDAGTARVLFEMRVATDQAKLLHGIVQTNSVDLRRSIHEVEGLLRIINEKASKRKEDIMVVKYTLNMLKTQLKNVREHQEVVESMALERKIVKHKKNVTNFKDMAGFRNLKVVHKKEIRRRREVEDVLVKLCR